MWAIPPEWLQTVMVILAVELGLLVIIGYVCASYLAGILERLPKAPEATPDGRMAPGPAPGRD
jgi:hypothetical protein